MTGAATSIGWYDANAEDFVERTFGPGMAVERARFLAHVPRGGAVLDAGCGSGRDALAFKEAGYAASAFDGSARLAEIAAANSGLPVRHLTFAEMDWDAAFDGVWACATLLHLAPADLPGALANIRRTLKPGGAFYCSFKEGPAQRFANGRHFTDMTLQSLRALLIDAGFELLDLWDGDDGRPDHAGERWVSAVSRRPMADAPPLA
ncbi:MAG TPA: class I SAM-dependent methyltransferase [Caulobacteraceae bacterium]|nr:class I SAM-dependent methyltransferase [Caulobacteraceae bacterium]